MMKEKEDKIKKSWNKFLFEEVQKEDIMSKYSFFCDMDGVIVDFINPAMERVNEALQKISKLGSGELNSGKSLYKLASTAAEQAGGEISNPPELTVKDIERPTPGEKTSAGRKFFYKVISADYSWWANLPWMPDGKELWEYYKRFNPLILSAPMSEPCKAGKLEWCKNNLGYFPEQIILTLDKKKFANYNGKMGFLIDDDFERYLGPFIASGGEGILHQNSTKTIRELQKRGIK